MLFMRAKMEPWRVINREIILNHSKYLTVENHTIELPDKKIIPDWPWVISPDYSIVLPRMEDGRILCFQQNKYAVEGITLAPIGGYLEPGEDPLQAAQRELLEEVGCRAEKWKHLGSFVTDGNHFCGTAHLFFADHTKQFQDPHRDDLEEMFIQHLSLDEVKQALMVGQFKVIAWTAAIALSLLYLTSDETL
jgi:ADP-ribose pyrophosphatase